ncbi:pre T-cell antigen receptor alpha [Aegotheles albertisi]
MARRGRDRHRDRDRDRTGGAGAGPLLRVTGGAAGAEPAAGMAVPWVLLVLLPLLPPGSAAGSLPTLAPPLSMVVGGRHRRLVVCVVTDLGPGSGDAVWISGGNGSALQSFAYGISREDGGTVCTVSLLPEDPPAEGDLACHVGPNRSSPARSSSPICISGTEEAAELCPGSTAALLVAMRVVLLKIALSDALLTSMLLAQS